MKKFLTYFLLAGALTMALACVNELDNQQQEKPNNDDLVEMTFVASNSNQTKTALMDGGKVYWLPGDEIAINGYKFTTDIKQASPVAEFKGSLSETDHYYAIYPYSAVVESYDGNNSKVKLPKVQTAYKGGFADDLNLSFAHSYGYYSSLDFYNALGYVKFTINDDSQEIISVNVKSRCEWEGVWAESAIIYIFGDNSSSITQSTDQDRLNNVELASDNILEAGDYYIALFPNTYSEGLSFEFKNKDGYIATLSIKQEVTLEAGVIQDLGLIQNLNFKPSPEMQKASERTALADLYNSTNGESWTNKWDMEKPISEWYGVELDENGYVKGINLENNNLNGSIPESIDALTRLETLVLSWNSLSGEIPSQICNLNKLNVLLLKKNSLSGPIPSDLGNLPLISLDLSYNKLTGNIPSSIASMMNSNLRRLILNHNSLSGVVPSEITNNEYFNEYWISMIYQGGGTNILDISSAEINAPVFEVTDINGNLIKSAEIYAQNEYTVLFEWGTGCGFSMEFIPKLKSWYDEYKDSGLEVIAYSGNSVDEVQNIIETYNLNWRNFKLEQFSDLFSNYSYFNSVPLTPFVAVVDKNGNIIHNPINDDRNNIIKLFEEKWGDFGGGEDEEYVSTDYTADKTVTTLQTANEGLGINIIIMGDGYSDRQIADGTYDEDINNAYEAFFSVAPYKHFQNLFNVYSVTAVSKNEGFGDGKETAFSGWLSDAGSTVGGSDETVFEYAKTVVSEDKLDETLMIVVMNDLRYGGTCYMYYDEDSAGDWGTGSAIAYLPLSTSSSNDTFAQVLTHEAGGHGFAKLVDEYYRGNETITQDAITIYESMEKYGFYKNIDFTDNEEEVKWAHFLDNTLYANEGLGIFEGGLASYAYGVYRPTHNSIMNNNTGGFNAPSREAIYYRIHKLAYGSDWDYNFEIFEIYDAKNRKTESSAAKSQKRRTNYVEKQLEPTPPPVLMTR